MLSPHIFLFEFLKCILKTTLTFLNDNEYLEYILKTLFQSEHKDFKVNNCQI